MDPTFSMNTIVGTLGCLEIFLFHRANKERLGTNSFLDCVIGQTIMTENWSLNSQKKSMEMWLVFIHTKTDYYFKQNFTVW